MARVTQAKPAFHLVYRLKTASGRTRWVSEDGYGVFDGRGTLVAVEGCLTDVTKSKRSEQLLAKQAIRDPLTGLYNRRFFDEHIRMELERAHRARRSTALLFCDLDRFKAINDRFGHEAGDDVLKAVAKAVRSATRGSDLVVRWGGDEFVVVLADTTHSGVHIATRRIQQAVSRLNENRQLHRNADISMSIGIAICPAHGEHADELVRLADRALFIAKKSGNGVHVGEDHYRLDEHAVKVVFQPIVDVWSNQVMGYEALSRDPEGRLTVGQLFKKYHAVGQLERLKAICFQEQLRVAGELGLARVFLNVDLDILTRLEPLSKPDRTDVILEISEREVLHDVDAHLATAMTWRAKGFKFAIDDFGAGFVSFPFVARLMPEYIKIDRSLVLQAASSSTFRGFSRHILMALRTYATEGIIAEGVENETELATMKAIGIFIIQGFLLGRPQDLSKLPATQAA